MKILVVGDTHGNVSRLRNLMEAVHRHIDAVIHTGDNETDAQLIAKEYPNLPLYGVCGNCDYGRYMPPLRIAELGGKRIFITHGHRYDVKFSLMRLAYAAQENQADICVYGHTHVPLVEEHNGMYIINPGSLSLPRGGSRASYGIIDIDERGNITPEIVELKEVENGYY